MRKEFFWIYLTVFINIIGFGMVFPLLPFFAETLHASPLQIGLIAATFSIGQFLASPFFGRLSDRFGRKPIIMFSLVASIISFVMLAEINSLIFVFLARFLNGISSAANFPVAQSYIADITTKEERTKYMGRISGMFSFGFVFGPVFGGVLGTYGFSTAFWSAAALTLVNLIVVFFFLPESIKQKSEKLILREGFLNLKAIYHGVRGDMKILFFLLSSWAFYISSFQVALPLFTQGRFNFGVLQNGIFLSSTAIIAALTQWVLLPLIVKKIGEVKTIFAGILLMGLGQLVAPFSPSVLFFYLSLVVSMMGSGLKRPAINAVLSKKTREGQGTTMGLAFSFESIGRFAGPLSAGLIIGSFGISAPFWISSAVLFIGLFAFWRVEMQKKQ
ncbi:MAG: MFS transporter [Candidatus Levybacteria bacterium]|nr:MFS transporter [Candidatus Levybacteria bacterium]